MGTLAILDKLKEVDTDMLAWWLAERQLPNGGLNGRPEKLEDVRIFSSQRVLDIDRRFSRSATVIGSYPPYRF